jgi:hypothetical protein
MEMEMEAETGTGTGTGGSMGFGAHRKWRESGLRSRLLPPVPVAAPLPPLVLPSLRPSTTCMDANTNLHLHSPDSGFIPTPVGRSPPSRRRRRRRRP